jgi:hypothetical protein
MILVELNEFNKELFSKAVETMKLPMIERVLAMQWTKTITQDKAERHGLDPWVQWVSVHTGKPSDIHGIEHLGDVSRLTEKQIWEVLNENGVSTGIWGAMNAKSRHHSKCLFFFPDPWTLSENAHPSELNELLSLPRYYARNYLDIDFLVVLKTTASLLKFLLRPMIFVKIAKYLPLFLNTLFNNGIKNYVLFSLFDIINALIFDVYKKKYHPKFSLIFLNSIAHAQHHHWTSDNNISKEMRCAIKLVDIALAIIFNTQEKNEDVLIINALTQRRSYDTSEKYLYRQKDPELFLEAIGVKFSKVDQLMTNDALVFFSSATDTNEAYRILNGAVINETPIFDVKKYPDDPKKLFYQLDFWNPVPENSYLLVNGKKIPFYNLFECVVRRSGEHIPQGDIFSSTPIFPSSIQNHEVFHYLLKHYGCA